MARTKKEGAAVTKTKKRAATKEENDGSRAVPAGKVQIRRQSQRSKKGNAAEKKKVRRGRKTAQLPRTPQYSPIASRQLFVSPSTEANVSYEVYDFVESPQS